MKNLLQKLSNFGGRSNAVPAAPMIYLAAFGKHPGWDDHIPGIGLETETLAHLKQSFYVSGIGAQIDSGAWEKLEPGKRMAGYAHTFLWLREGHTLLGRLWSSADRKGRAKYPMVLCLDSTGISSGLLLANAWQELEQLQNTCRSFATAEPVAAACQSSQAQLRALLESLKADDADVIPLEARRSFLENPQFGDRKVGLLRILHELGGLRAGGPAERRSCHLRVPAISHAQEGIFRLWLDFFRCAVPANVPLLLILRDGVEWLDVIVGEPSGEEFFCLQAAPLAAPLSTQIPYELKPELDALLQQLTAAFMESSAISSDDQKRMPPPATPEAGRGSGEESPASRKSKLPLVLLVLAVGVTAGAGWFFVVSRKSVRMAASPSQSASSQLPSPATLDRQQQYQTTMTQAQAALQRQQFETVLAKANAALAIKPGDQAALNLQNQAQRQLAAQVAEQKREADFRAALIAGQSALGKNNFDEALKQAQIALGLKSNDQEASNLLAHASRDKKMEQDNQKYALALKEAQNAFQQQDYNGVLAKVKSALAIQPDGAAALDLQKQAQTKLNELAAAHQQQEQFNALLQAGQAAYDQKDYATAASKADAALNLMPENSAARTLQAAARKQAAYMTALSAGQAALQQSAYDEALRQAAAALTLDPAGADALKLKADASAGADLQQVQALMNKADYDSALSLCQKHPNEPAFAALEDRISQSELATLDEQLEIYQVWFGLISQDAAKSAKARMPEQKKKAQEIESSNFSGQNTKYYTDLVANLESRFNTLQKLDPRRAAIIAKLKKKINEHS